jgi:hypothetical protein
MSATSLCGPLRAFPLIPTWRRCQSLLDRSYGLTNNARRFGLVELSNLYPNRSIAAGTSTFRSISATSGGTANTNEPSQ